MLYKTASNSGSGGDSNSSSDKNIDASGATDAGLFSNRSIDSKVLKELKKMGLDKKFKNAMDKGLAPRREGTSGIIKLTENEIEYKGGYEYIYKIKVPKAGGHTRVYGRINESGELIFDLILKK
ncbi:hypothetical protein [Clostridium lundense]|uniref:hypothetical protein n=1 Tax=Clostridium lundense TaxID=319475 RepID=UPI0004894A21|nr:hypothetical protein [Clostridium lundense]